MSKQQLLTEYYTARWRYHLASKGCKTGWERAMVRARAACIDAGILV